MESRQIEFFPSEPEETRGKLKQQILYLQKLQVVMQQTESQKIQTRSKQGSFQQLASRLVSISISRLTNVTKDRLRCPTGEKYELL